MILDKSDVAAVDESALWQSFKLHSANARKALIDIYYPTVKKMAAYIFARRICDDVAFDDYLQYGLVGLMEAMTGYDVNKAASFKTYASYRIKGAIYNGLEKESEKRSQVAYQRRAHGERIREALDAAESSEAFSALVDTTIALAFGHLLGSLADMGGRYLDGIPYHNGELSVLKAEINHIIESLPEMERKVIQQHYFKSLSFTTISERLGISKGRVSQIHKAVLARIRRQVNEPSLLEKQY